MTEALQSCGFGTKHSADEAREHQSTNNVQFIYNLGRNCPLQKQLPFSDVLVLWSPAVGAMSLAVCTTAGQLWTGW